MDNNQLKELLEAYNQVHQLDEISADTALAASKEAGRQAGILSGLSGGDPKVKRNAVKKREQSERLYNLQVKKRKTQVTREDLDIFDTVLEFLCVEGYAETLEDAEWMMANELTPEDIEEILEAYKEPNLQKMRSQEDRHMKKAIGYGGSRESKNRSSKMSSIRSALERGEDPRADTYGGKRAERGNPPLDHRAAFSKNPLNKPPRRVKKPGV